MKKETWIGGILVLTFAVLSGIKNGIDNAERKEEALERYLNGYYDHQSSNEKTNKAVLLDPKSIISDEDSLLTASAPDSIAKGEQFRLSYTVKTLKVKDFHASSFDGFDVLMGPSSSRNSTPVIVKGEVAVINTITYTYVLMGMSEGEYSIPGASIVVDGKRKTFPSLTIKVFDPIDAKEDSVTHTSDERIKRIMKYKPPKTWRDYEIGNAFTISIPPTLELRQDADPYTKDVKELHAKGIRVNISSDKIVFQQKGLSIRHPEALSTYSRIIMSIERGKKGDFPRSTEFEELDIVTVKEFQEMARVATVSSGYEVKGFIDVGWKNYDGTYALEISYTRTGEAGKNTNVKTCCLFNDDKMAEITLSYRKEDAGKWEKDLSNVIRTFKWKR